MGKIGQSYQLTGKNTQRGIGVIGVLIVVSIIAVTAMFVMAAGPMYFNHMTVMEIAKDVAADQELKDKPIRQVRDSINKRFQTNSLWDLDPEEVIKVHREKNKGLVLEVNYEARRPLFYNMDLVTHFNEQTIGLN
ncbi:MAG: DUF4845 domain-containing protein [Gammaproteobacteria bacterium]|nr:DUF4845 domain-containing protein [Gammaproteobacteria bacterium]